MNDDLINKLIDGGVAILRTDTLYGIVGRANNKQTVLRIAKIKSRNPNKPFIVLLSNFDLAYDNSEVIRRASHGHHAATVVVDSPSAPEWLRHEDGTVAYRVPNDRSLRLLLGQTGPLVAPSANREGDTPASSIKTAKDYFGKEVDLYIDGGEVPEDQPPSIIIKVSKSGQETRLR